MSTRTKSLFAAAYILHVLWIILLASVPPVSRDALTHHLAVPKLWVEGGGIHERPDILFSYYPQLLDVLYMAPVALGHDIAAKYLHFAFALLTAVLIFLFVRRRLGPSWAALSGLMFLTLPLIVKLSVTVYVDLGLIFFTTAALFSVAIWLEETGKTRWLVLAAVCSGLALGTKYNALVSFLLLSLLLPFFYLFRFRRDNPHAEQLNAVKFGVLFVAISLLVFSPWLARNYSLTGNPLYPLAQGVFAGQAEQLPSPDQTANAEAHARAAIGEQAGKGEKPLGPLLTRRLVHEESLPYTLLIPLRIFFEGEDDNPKYFDGRLNPMLLLLPLALLVLARRAGIGHREHLLLGTYAVLMIVLVFLLTDMRLRWVATIVPPLVVLTTCGLWAIHRQLAERSSSTGKARAVTGLLVIAYFVPNLLYAHALFGKIDPVPYVTGQVDYASYVDSHRPEYAAISLANQLVATDKKVLGLYLGNRRYYFSVDAIVVNAVFTSVAERSESGDGIADRLLGLGYSHIVVHTGLFRQWLGSTDERTAARVNAFADERLKQLLFDDGFGLYEIMPQTPP
ncbi:MAG: glycosyltransferase family 39 protein [Gammaproteobacteria bacterium]|jgi:4-amino-4-deoxy-L-arabinose transferase-like glycosyltransferase|nr:glycosyltransferase family 39 protein [Gammaproteobacteria bacterium]MDH3906284.1 glycosyltransferase family 39 protein [Gammaproteobacteria bacterium]MDH4003678.1 glycosyltransferase family 39 protein [Gammaproteobacteria bacterium]NCF58724.1 phospholipid carrier-dependent glycosyltransferase [Gammaproteobacteria bacterium]